MVWLGGAGDPGNSGARVTFAGSQPHLILPGLTSESTPTYVEVAEHISACRGGRSSPPLALERSEMGGTTGLCMFHLQIWKT